MSEELLTTQELSKRWGIAINTLNQYRCYKTGCSFVKIGKMIRYRLVDVIEFETKNYTKINL
jgi:hypothetical protein